MKMTLSSMASLQALLDPERDVGVQLFPELIDVHGEEYQEAEDADACADFVFARRDSV
jgi:hypothetical protein